MGCETRKGPWNLCFGMSWVGGTHKARTEHQKVTPSSSRARKVTCTCQGEQCSPHQGPAETASVQPFSCGEVSAEVRTQLTCPTAQEEVQKNQADPRS